MAVPAASAADRKRRPILLLLTVFLLLSAILVLLFLFLGPSSTQSLPFLPSRLASPSIPSLPAPHHHHQQSPTTIPTPGSSPDPQPNAPAQTEAKPATSAAVDASTAVEGGGGTSDPPPSRPADDASEPSRPVDHDDDDGAVAQVRWETCKARRGVSSPADYIPCLDNIRAIKALRSRRHMEHRERHCTEPPPRCLVRTPAGYRLPVPWPQSRDMVRTLRACLCRIGNLNMDPRLFDQYVMRFQLSRKPIWYNNVPHPKLVEYKKDQKWVTKSGDYLVFPGGGTQFKDGVARYIQFVEQIMPSIQWGTHTRTVLDVGCGVASFGGYLLDRNVITMSLAPKDEHEAQIQFALERGIPAFLGVIGTQKLPFPDNAFDVVHCARCRVRWYENGGKPLLELNRVLRPGGFFIWSATPVYREEKRDQDDWNAMVTLTKSICWRTVVKSQDVNGIGAVIYQKPASNSCYLERKTSEPHLCSEKDGSRFPWYAPLDSCILPTAVSSSDETNNSPLLWPERLVRYTSVPYDSATTEKFDADTKYWKQVISDMHSNDFPVNWSSVRNVMDMNAGFGGFAAALVDQPLWVMNVVPIGQSDTLPVIFSRGLIGVYHDWCESFNTYPRTYDVLHMSGLLESLTKRCDILEIAAEVDRILRPGRWFVLKDSMEMIKKMRPVLRSLHYETVVVKRQYLVATKSFWRPAASRSG